MSATMCARPACRRPARESMEYCSTGCRVVTNELTAAHNVLAAVGSSPLTDELLDAAENLDRAWIRLQSARRGVRTACRAAGWTPAQAAALLSGRTTAERVTTP
jgi:hypothetical protein